MQRSTFKVLFCLKRQSENPIRFPSWVVSPSTARCRSSATNSPFVPPSGMPRLKKLPVGVSKPSVSMKSWRTSETFDRNPPPRIFVFARKQRVVPLSDKFGFVRQRFSLCEARVAPESRPFFKPYMDMNRKPTDKTDKKPRTPSYKYSFRLNEE
mgnify:CR=1 FL=1